MIKSNILNKVIIVQKNCSGSNLFTTSKFYSSFQKISTQKKMFRFGLNSGTLLSIQDGIALSSGLRLVASGELVVIIPKKATSALLQGMVLSLATKYVSIVVFGSDLILRQGDRVIRTGRIMEIPLSSDFFGRVVDSLGNMIDRGPNVKSNLKKKVDTKAEGIIGRTSVHEPMQTGVTVVDSITPIGCGQRELVIGDRQTGKSTLCVQSILTQDVFGFLYCVYVAVGQKKSTIAQISQFLKERGALKHTVIFSAPSSEPATLQFLAPYSGCTFGE
jgi:F-type H+-transporting ATPase subunit alpha